MDKVAQNMVIYEWREDQLFSEAERLKQIIDLWDTADKKQYFVITEIKSTIFCHTGGIIQFFFSTGPDFSVELKIQISKVVPRKIAFLLSKPF